MKCVHISGASGNAKTLLAKSICESLNLRYKCLNGGRYREDHVRGNIELVEKFMREAGTNKVFDKIPTHADIHSYRAGYATAHYKENARDKKHSI